jgi:short-subunit dehydrogenase
MGGAPSRGGDAFPERPRVWVTGASGGLGESVALAFAAREAHLILSARRSAELERVARACGAAGAASTRVVLLDQADARSVEAALEAATRDPLDVAVLNGGVGSRSSALDTDAATLRRVLDTNFLANAELASGAARHFLKEGVDGRIAVVSSVQAFFGLPSRAAYAASKHALTGYCDSLRADLAGETAARVSVTVLAPGYIATGHSVNALAGDGARYGVDDASTKRGAPPEAVAAALLEAVEAREAERVVAPGASAVAARLLRALAPTALFSLLAKRARDERRA